MVSIEPNGMNPHRITVSVGDTFELPRGAAISIKGDSHESVYFLKNPATVAILEWEGEMDELDDDDDIGDPVLDHPDCQMVYSVEDLQKDWADIKSGRVKTIPWEEVKRNAHAIHG